MTQSFHSDARPNSERMRQEELDRAGDRPLEDPRIARERADERERAEARDWARERSSQARANELVAAQGFGTSFLGSSQMDEPWQQWRQIQANFVDNPRDAVSDAHRLVSELIDDIVRKFENERNQMERRWSTGEDVDTEDLRRCLQTYRDLFGRLLANASEAKA